MLILKTLELKIAAISETALKLLPILGLLSVGGLFGYISIFIALLSMAIVLFILTVLFYQKRGLKIR